MSDLVWLHSNVLGLDGCPVRITLDINIEKNPTVTSHILFHCWAAQLDGMARDSDEVSVNVCINNWPPKSTTSGVYCRFDINIWQHREQSICSTDNILHNNSSLTH